jgi:hypothetical protein
MFACFHIISAVSGSIWSAAGPVTVLTAAATGGLVRLVFSLLGSPCSSVVIRVHWRLLWRFEAHASIAGALGARLEPMLDAVAAVEAIAESFGVADEMAGALSPCLPAGEQRLRPFPRVGVALAAFVEPCGETVLRVEVGGGRCSNGLGGREDLGSRASSTKWPRYAGELPEFATDAPKQ